MIFFFSQYCVCVYIFQRFGPPDQDYYYKKTDEPQADRPQDMEEHITPNDGESCLQDLQNCTVLVVVIKFTTSFFFFF